MLSLIAIHSPLQLNVLLILLNLATNELFQV